MKIIDQSHEILHITPNLLHQIEAAGRTCYKSEDKITEGTAEKFVKMLIKKGHEAMLEFGDITVKFITNRAIANELVRHRLCSFAQNSQRYIKYDQIEIIRPVWADKTLDIIDKMQTDPVLSYEGMFSDEHDFSVWYEAIECCEWAYQTLLKLGWRPEQARDVLPNATKTEIVMKVNAREMRHILDLRCSKQAHPQMRGLMMPLLKELHEKIPVIFDDLYENYIK